MVMMVSRLIEKLHLMKCFAGSGRHPTIPDRILSDRTSRHLDLMFLA